MIEYGYEHGELTIGDAAKCAAVAVPGFAKAVILVPAAWIVLSGHARGVVERIAEPGIAGLPHADNTLLSALPGDGSGAGVGT